MMTSTKGTPAPWLDIPEDDEEAATAVVADGGGGDEGDEVDLVEDMPLYSALGSMESLARSSSIVARGPIASRTSSLVVGAGGGIASLNAASLAAALASNAPASTATTSFGPLSAIPSDRALHVRDAIDRAGYGRYHYKLLLYSTLAIASQGTYLAAIEFVQHTLKTQWAIQSWEVLVLAILGSQVIAAPVVGALANKYGRRALFSATGVCSIIGTLLSVLVHNAALLVVAQILIGIGFAQSVVVFSLLAETLPSHARSPVLMMFQIGSPLCGLLVGALASFIIPNWGWRPLLWVTLVPVLAGLAGSWFVPESPSWLVAHNRCEEAVQVIQSVAMANDIRLPAFRLVRLKDDLPSKLQSLVAPGYLRQSLALWLAWFTWGVSSFVVQGFGLSVMTIFGGTASVGGYNYVGVVLAHGFDIIGILFATSILKELGRKGCVILFWGICAVGCACGFVPLSVAAIVAAVTSRLAVAAVGSALWLLTTESYPTVMRSLGVSAAVAIGSLGGFLGVLLGELQTPMTIQLACVLLGALATLIAMQQLSKETATAHVDDSPNDARLFELTARKDWSDARPLMSSVRAIVTDDN